MKGEFAKLTAKVNVAATQLFLTIAKMVTFGSYLSYMKHQSRNKACSFTEEAEKRQWYWKRNEKQN